MKSHRIVISQAAVASPYLGRGRKGTGSLTCGQACSAWLRRAAGAGKPGQACSAWLRRTLPPMRGAHVDSLFGFCLGPSAEHAAAWEHETGPRGTWSSLAVAIFIGGRTGAIEKTDAWGEGSAPAHTSLLRRPLFVSLIKVPQVRARHNVPGVLPAQPPIFGASSLSDLADHMTHPV
jgi:hypothetical protein